MKKVIALTVAALLALATIAPVLADQADSNPPGHKQQGGQNGYEGHPGNQN